MSTLYVADLDGTLLNENGVLSGETVSILKPLLAQGLQFTVATARSPATVVDLLAPLALHTPAVLMTGAILYDLNATRVLKTNALSPACVRDICQILESKNQEALAYCIKNEKLWVYYKEFCCDFERAFVAERMHSPYKTFCQTARYAPALAGGDTLMFLLCVPHEALAKSLCEAFSAVPNLRCYYYADEYKRGGYTLEIYDIHCTKAHALADVIALTGADNIISFGDNINDIPLFSMSTESCAVANAVPAAKHAATRVIGANTNSGVAKWIAAHFAGERT
ncbi:MAG: HAD hydrolase family protein [Ruthenibacterium sp.]